MADPQKAKLLVWQCILTNKLDNMIKILGTGVISVNDPISPVQIRPLHFACAKERTDFVRYLLDQGADPNAVEQTNKTALHIAASESRESDEILQMLIDKGAEIDAVTIGGETPLMKALYFGRPFAVKFLLENGASLTAVNAQGRSIRDYAIATRDDSIIGIVRNFIPDL